MDFILPLLVCLFQKRDRMQIAAVEVIQLIAFYRPTTNLVPRVDFALFLLYADRGIVEEQKRVSVLALSLIC